ncbi:MAG: Na/Pi cotransporter family protein [Ignavibacteriae bacterium]|nr:Na/Pi cotransporter family protein [Ignavibacteriota bacterium]MCB9207915.1 Na/Pi cotransporter family protein [Ignavibacteriales bacterium]MCB9258685.1 Na/Pi cotransporter family protein [Ignavibacteriales bacterium]
MLKELISVFKSDTLLDRAYKRSFEMLDLTHKMFLEAKNVLRHTESNQVSFDINDQDIAVNKYQREVRKDVFNHLAMSGTETLASDLVLVNIVIDVERIGDITKNIVEVAQGHKEKLSSKLFDAKVAEMEKAVSENFEKTITAFKEADEDLATKIIEEYKWISKASDDMLLALMNNEEQELKAGSAVALALYIRQLKRINSHLRNVASSIVNPFHRIGYKPKKKKE